MKHLAGLVVRVFLGLHYCNLPSRAAESSHYYQLLRSSDNRSGISSRLRQEQSRREQETPNPLVAAVLPPISTTLFASNVTHRHDFCERRAAYERGDIKHIGDALEGAEVSVALMKFERYLNLDPATGKVNFESPGMYAELMDEMARRAKVTWRDSYGFINQPPAGANYTFQDVLQWSTDTYDVSAEFYFNSAQRKGLGISFLLGTWDSSLIMIEKKVEPENKMFTIFLPFHWSVWLVIVVTGVFSAICYRFIHKLGSSPAEYAYEQEKKGVAAYYTFQAMMQNNLLAPQTHGGRIFSLSLQLFSIVIVAAYTANLTGFLINSNKPRYLAKSLPEAAAKQIPICVFQNSAVEKYVRRYHPKANIVLSRSFDDQYEMLRGGECLTSLIPSQNWLETERREALNGDCPFARVGFPVNTETASFALKADFGIKCTSFLSAVLDFHLTDMKADGFVSSAWDKHLDSISPFTCGTSTKEDSDDNEDAYVMTVPDIGGLVLLQCCAAVFSVIVAWFEKKKDQSKQTGLVASGRRKSANQNENGTEETVNEGSIEVQGDKESPHGCVTISIKESDLVDLEEAQDSSINVQGEGMKGCGIFVAASIEESVRLTKKPQDLQKELHIVNGKLDMLQKDVNEKLTILLGRNSDPNQYQTRRQSTLNPHIRRRSTMQQSPLGI